MKFAKVTFQVGDTMHKSEKSTDFIIHIFVNNCDNFTKGCWCLIHGTIYNYTTNLPSDCGDIKNIIPWAWLRSTGSGIVPDDD